MSDYETMQRRRSMIVGMFVIVSIIAFFWLIFKFGDLPMIMSEVRSFEVRIQFPSAPGVQRDTPVRFCGYQIGRVTKLMPPDNLRDLNTGQYYFQTVVIASIDNQYYGNIPTSVESKLMTRGLGSSYIELRVQPKDTREGKFLVEGSLLQGSTGVSSELFPEETQKKLDELISGINSFVGSSNEIVGDNENKANLKEILANLAVATKQASEAITEIREMSATGKTVIEKTDERMENLTNSLVSTSDKLSSVLTHLDSVVAKIDNGDGTASKLINDGRLYEQLLEDSRQMELVLKDLKSFVVQSKEKGIPIKLK